MKSDDMSSIEALVKKVVISLSEYVHPLKVRWITELS